MNNSNFEHDLNTGRFYEQEVLELLLELDFVKSGRLSTEAENKSGVDIWLERVDGHIISIDVKSILVEKSSLLYHWEKRYNDQHIPIELSGGSTGGTFDKERGADLILFYWTQLGSNTKWDQFKVYPRSLMHYIVKKHRAGEVNELLANDWHTSPSHINSNFWALYVPSKKVCELRDKWKLMLND